LKKLIDFRLKHFKNY